MTKAAPHPRLWRRLQPLGVIVIASTILVGAAIAGHRPEPANACAADLHAVAIGAGVPPTAVTARPGTVHILARKPCA